MAKRKPKGYWNFERCWGEALRHLTRTSFFYGSPGAYACASRNGWLDKICSHMTSPHKPHGYWTPDRIREISMKYDSRTAFKHGDNKAYQAAQQHGWLDEVCSHMTACYTTWSYESVMKEALKYEFRTAFEDCSPGAYAHAARNNYLDEACSHMSIIGNRCKRAIYALEFPNNSVYVGLSFNPEGRLKKHGNSSNNKHVREYVKSQAYYHEVIFEGWYDQRNVKIAEEDTIRYYEDLGYNVLNIHKAGGLGGSSIKWTKDEIHKVALNYNSRSEFCDAFGGAYGAARKYGWLDDVCSHMEPLIKPPGYWTYERVVKEALKYTNKTAFTVGSSRAYNLARLNGWLDEICSHMISINKPKGYWTLERCFKEALKFTYKTDFHKTSSAAYHVLLKVRLLDDACSHMRRKPLPEYWTLDLVRKTAAKCNTRGEFIARFGNAYKKAWNKGWLDDVCAHMNPFKFNG